MADLFTHFVAARIPGALIRDRRLQVFLVFGTFLPDIASKGIYWVLQNRQSSQLATHSATGVLLISYLACLLVQESLRRPAFFLLAAGGVIHVLVDLTKSNMGLGAAFPFLPFSIWGLEFGWIDSENVVLLLPFDLAILGLLRFLEWRFRRVQQ